MSNSCNQTLTLSNPAEIVKYIGWGKNTPLRWNKVVLVLKEQK